MKLKKKIKMGKGKKAKVEIKFTTKNGKLFLNCKTPARVENFFETENLSGSTAYIDKQGNALKYYTENDNRLVDVCSVLNNETLFYIRNKKKTDAKYSLFDYGTDIMYFRDGKKQFNFSFIRSKGIKKGINFRIRNIYSIKSLELYCEEFKRFLNDLNELFMKEYEMNFSFKIKK